MRCSCWRSSVRRWPHPIRGRWPRPASGAGRCPCWPGKPPRTVAAPAWQVAEARADRPGRSSHRNRGPRGPGRPRRHAVPSRRRKSRRERAGLPGRRRCAARPDVRPGQWVYRLEKSSHHMRCCREGQLRGGAQRTGPGPRCSTTTRCISCAARTASHFRTVAAAGDVPDDRRAWADIPLTYGELGSLPRSPAALDRYLASLPLPGGNQHRSASSRSSVACSSRT